MRYLELKAWAYANAMAVTIPMRATRADLGGGMAYAIARRATTAQAIGNGSGCCGDKGALKHWSITF